MLRFLTAVSTALCAAWVLPAGAMPSQMETRIDLTPRSGRSFGIGGNLWAAPTAPFPVTAVGMRLLRLWINNGLSGPSTPTNVTRSEADAWANQTVHTDGAIDTLASLARNLSGIKPPPRLLLGGGAFGALYCLPNQPTVFDPARIHDAAEIWAAVVGRMAGADCLGSPPAYIELSNEPNGHWNTYIPPTTWAALACAVRAALDARGLSSVGISGPGTSLGSSAAYLDAMAAESRSGVGSCVSLLSVHTWEDTSTANGPHEMASLLDMYATLRARYDPNHTLLWAATEYGARTDRIGGQVWPADRTVNRCYNTTPCYGASRDCSLPSDAEVLSTRYATRVAAFTLLHMNTGFDEALYWWVADYGWSPLCFGLVTRHNVPTPLLIALTRLFAMAKFELNTLIPVNRTWVDDDTVTAAAVGNDGQGALWVAHAPTIGTASLNRTFVLTLHQPNATVVATACYPGGCEVVVSPSRSKIAEYHSAAITELHLTVGVPAHAAVAVFLSRPMDVSLRSKPSSRDASST